MRNIANIVVDSGRFDDSELYNIVRNYSDITDYTIPTLIIGWEKVKETFPEANILDYKIKDNVYWTYGNREKRDRYERNIIKFREDAIKLVKDNVKYRFFNILTADKTEKSDFIARIKDSNRKYVYFANDMAYIYFDNEEYVYGLSLRDIDYEGGDRKNFLKLLYSNQLTEIIKEKEQISFNLRNSLQNNLYIIPYLCA